MRALAARMRRMRGIRATRARMRAVTPPHVTAPFLVPRRFFLPTRARYDRRYRRLSTCRRLCHEQNCLSSLHTPHTLFFRTAKSRAKTAHTPHTLARQHTHTTRAPHTRVATHSCTLARPHAHDTLYYDSTHTTHSCETAHAHHTLL